MPEMTNTPPANELANLPKDLAIIKMENDNIFGLAAARPRDYAEILTYLKQQVDTCKSFAQQAIYTKPVGKNQSGDMQYARGLSVRAAEALAEAYGFNRVRTDVTIIDDDTVRVEATFVDFQRGRVWQDSGICSKFYTAHGGSRRRMSDDRFYNLLCKSEASKRIREVILRSVSPGLKSDFTDHVNTRIHEFLDDSTVHKMIAEFAGKDVKLEMLEALLKRTKSNWTKDDRAMLLGIWNSIDQEEVTVREVFGGLQAEDAPTGVSKLEEVFGQQLRKDEPVNAVTEPEPSPTATPEPTGEPVESWPIKSLGKLPSGTAFSTMGTVHKFAVKEFKNDKVRVDLEIGEGAVSHSFIRWGAAPEWLAVGVSVDIHHATVREYKGKPQLTIDAWKPLS